jgi:hypothetical protein
MEVTFVTEFSAHGYLPTDKITTIFGVLQSEAIPVIGFSTGRSPRSAGGGAVFSLHARMKSLSSIVLLSIYR